MFGNIHGRGRTVYVTRTECHEREYKVNESNGGKWIGKAEKKEGRGKVPTLITYLLTPYSTVLPAKLTGLHLVKKFPAFYGTRRFITAFTSARHLSLSQAISIQSTPPHPTSWKSILILSSHLRLGLPSSLFPWGFPTKTPYNSLPSPITYYMPRPSHFSSFMSLARYLVSSADH